MSFYFVTFFPFKFLLHGRKEQDRCLGSRFTQWYQRLVVAVCAPLQPCPAVCLPFVISGFFSIFKVIKLIICWQTITFSLLLIIIIIKKLISYHAYPSNGGEFCMILHDVHSQAPSCMAWGIRWTLLDGTG